MKQTIYEEIQRITLLSNYDSSKTLSEQLLSSPIPNNQGQYSQFNSNNITQTAPKSSPATTTPYTKAPDYKSAFNNSMGIKTPDLTTPVNDWGNKYPCVTNNKTSKTGVTTDNMIYYWSNGVYYKSDGTKNIQGTGNAWVKFTCNDPEFKTKTVTNPVATPPELKNIKAFQDWLDVNAKGWAKGYNDGIINKGKNGGGYGKFGPRTQEAWKNPKYKDGYLKSLQTPTTATQTAPGPDDDIVQP